MIDWVITMTTISSNVVYLIHLRMGRICFEEWVSPIVQWNLLDQLVYVHHPLLP
jgi:hypothetical protein